MGVRRSRSADSRVRLRGFVYLLALLATVVAPLGATVTIAGQAEDSPPIEQEEEQRADPPIEIETAEPIEPQPDTGTQQQDQQPATETPPQDEQPAQQVPDQPVQREPDAGIFSLQLVKRVCPAKEGFDPQRSDYPTLDDACQLEVADPASFFLVVTDATGEVLVVNEVAPFFELPVGTTLAAEKHSGGYGDPVVFCSFGKGTQPERMEVVNRQVTIEPRPDILVTCEFFNPELPPAPQASLTIHKRICADGYDIGSEKADPMVDCTEPVSKVVFDLADDDPVTPDQQQGAGAVITGGVVFEGLAEGRYTVTETPPEGVTGAVVWACDGIGSEAAPPLSEGFVLEIDIPAGTEVVCYWFNLRGGEPKPDADGSITVVKWVCPEGYDPTERGADPLLDCTKPLDDVGFALIPADRDVEARKGSTGDDGRGTVTFDGLPAGSYTLEENLPEGFADAFAWYCTEDPRQRQTPDAPLATGARLTIDLAAGQDLWCHWYNVPLSGDDAQGADVMEPTPGPVEATSPAPEPAKPEGDTSDGNELGIAVFLCPGGMEASTDVPILLELCDPYEGMGFGLLSADGPSSRFSDAEGQAQWGSVPAGSWQMEQITPVEFGEPRVFCAPAGTPAPSPVPVTGSVIQGEFSGEGESQSCWWFNSPSVEPGGSGRLSVSMYTCPAGTTYDAVSDAWLENGTSDCAPAGGVDVTLSYTDATGTGQVERTMTSGTNGRIFWNDGIPAAAWTLTHPPETGYGNPLVICGYVDPPQGVDAGWRVHTGVLNGIYHDAFAFDDMRADCSWFSIPVVDPGGANRIHLTVSDCPVGTTADAIVAAWPAGGAGDCTRAEGTEVTLSYADASGVGDVHRPLVTDEDGEAFWPDGVPTGPWSLSQAVEPGYGNPLVICRYEDVPGPPSDASDWRIDPDAEGGVFTSTFAGVYDHPPHQQTDLLDRCQWFNIPLPGEAGDADLPTSTEPQRPTPWSEVPPEPAATDAPGGAATGSITIIKATCPAGFDIDRNGADPMGACTKLTDGISFSLLPAEDASAGQRGHTGDDGRGALTFDGLPAGSYQVVEEASAGSPEAFVWYCTDDPRTQRSPAGPLERGEALTLELDEGQILYCLWFNVAESGEAAVVIPSPVQAVPVAPKPPDDSDADDPVAAIPDVHGPPVVPGGPQLDLPVVGEVRISAFACEGEVEVLSYAIDYGLEYYRTACTEPLQVSFTLEEHPGTEGTHRTQQSTDASGHTTFRPVALGEVAIDQDSARGYFDNTQHVFCRTSGGSSESGAWRQRSITGQFQVTLDTENPTLECESFNFPLGAAVWEDRVRITRYYCLDPDMSQSLAGQCVPDEHRTTTFQHEYETFPGSSATFDWVTFHIDVSPTRSLTITQQLPDGFSPPVAQCRIVDYNQRSETISDLGWLEADAEGSIAFEPIGIDNALHCDWYSIVHSPGRSTVYSHTCSSQVFTAHEACEVDGTVRQYELEYREDDDWQHHSTVTTGSDGSHVWEDMRPGTYRLVQGGGAWCHMTTDHPIGVGLIEVVSGQDTIVRVYTCAGAPGNGGGLPGQCVNINRLCPRS